MLHDVVACDALSYHCVRLLQPELKRSQLRTLPDWLYSAFTEAAGVILTSVSLLLSQLHCVQAAVESSASKSGFILGGGSLSREAAAAHATSALMSALCVIVQVRTLYVSIPRWCAKPAVQSWLRGTWDSLQRNDAAVAWASFAKTAAIRAWRGSLWFNAGLAGSAGAYYLAPG